MWGWPLICTNNALNQHNTISWFNYSHMHWGAYSIWRNNLLLQNSNLIKPCCNEVGREWAFPDNRNPGESDVALSAIAVDLQSLLGCTEFTGHFLCLGVDNHSTIWTNLLDQVYVIAIMVTFNLTILRVQQRRLLDTFSTITKGSLLDWYIGISSISCFLCVCSRTCGYTCA